MCHGKQVESSLGQVTVELTLQFSLAEIEAGSVSTASTGSPTITNSSIAEQLSTTTDLVWVVSYPSNNLVIDITTTQLGDPADAQAPGTE